MGSRFTRRSARRLRGGVPPALVLMLTMTLLTPAVSAQVGQVFVPIGGGYSSATLEGFARVVIDNTSDAIDETVDILVVPSTYGDDPVDRAENIDLAGERTQQIEDACTAVLTPADGFDLGCEATLLILFDRADAENRDNSSAFTDAGVDGAFILGGDQTIAMRVLVNTPAEAVMTDAYNRGVVFGGTSAGNAVESQSMIAGYTEEGWPYNALERPMIDIWWFDGDGSGDDQRGLVFGSENVIWDQHFYERGRFGRLLNVIAQSDEQFDGESRLGVGVDYATGVTLTNDSILAHVFGDTSVALIDGESLDASFAFTGDRQTLSGRDILTHIVAADEGITYDVAGRDLIVDGDSVGLESAPAWPDGLLDAPGDGTLILGGDVSLDLEGPAVADLAARIGEQPSGEVIILGVGGSPQDLHKLTGDYRKALRGYLRPRDYQITQIVQHMNNRWERLQPQDLDDAAAVIVVGGDQARMDKALEDSKFREIITYAVENVPVVMTDASVTAVMGSWYVTDPNPTDDDYQDVAIESFWEDSVSIAPGLGIIPGVSFESRLTWDQRWGRLYSVLTADPTSLVFGISEMTTLVIDDDGATVQGERSIIGLDGRAGTYRTGTNGAFSALNVVMDVFAPGDAVE